MLPVTRDPYEARELFEPDLAGREDYIGKYRTGFGFHPTHAVMALYPLKRLRHAGRVIVAKVYRTQRRVSTAARDGCAGFSSWWKRWRPPMQRS